MLVVTHCQTCGQPIGHLNKIYLTAVRKYARESKTNIDPDTEQNQRKKGIPSPEYQARQELIDKHKMDGRRQCCLYALFVNYDTTDIIS